MAQRNTYFEDEVIQKKIDIKQFGKVLRYILPYRRLVVLVVVLMIASSAVSLITPLFLREIIDHVVVNESYRELALIVCGMAALAAIEISVTFVHQRLTGKMGHGAIAAMRQDIFYKLQELPFDYFDSKPDGKIVVRVTEYINELANFFTNFVVLLMVYLVKIVIVTFFMLSISPPLTLVVLGTVLPMMFCVFALRHALKKIFPRHRAKISNRTAFLVESIMGEKVIKNSNRAGYNLDTYLELHTASLRNWMQIVRRNELNTPIVEGFWNIGMLGLYGLALAMLLAGSSAINAGTVVVFTSYMSLFSGPLTQIAIIIQNLAQVSSNLEQVFDTIETKVTLKNKESAVTLDKVRGAVDFDHVSFAYEEGVNILKDFDLHVRPGEMIALVGPTGAGKTTVINMLTRFYDVQSGAVRIDGVDVRDAALDSLRRQVGVLMQDPFIFHGSILENIRYGRPDATDEQCMAAARLIHAEEHILRLKNGYHHVLEERGQGLSAGEKQLISFARIVLKAPAIVILDEATSSVDTATESLIQQALAVVLKGKTSFIVAHRLSTIRNADRILYIADKGIAEQGTHEELMAKKGLYYQLH